MTRTLIGALAALLFILGMGAARAGQATRLSFAEQVFAIDTIYTDASRSSILEDKLLPVIPQFNALSERAEDTIDDCIAFLSETSHTEQQRRIAILAMQKLSLRGYVRFADAVLDLNEKGLASRNDVIEAVMPSHSHVYVDNFLNPDVRQILYRTRDIPNMYPEIKDSLFYTLIGLDYVRSLL
ncbi:MAG: hypothetical protein JO107_10105 [Hyphomicrobiales bacterium]|nr:hypothetical protein [Hyphomicrobiales bacterium]MBV8663443.1 hypothetical protein [Hyphomicrobiales bacterium]